jgi:hypothetical protein
MDVGFELRAVPGLIRQGDLLLVPVSGFPDGVRRARSGRLVLAEGEATGHAHVVDDERASLHRQPWTSAATYLRVEGHEPVFLVHEEHDRLVVPPGLYEVRRQREYAPRGRSRRVSDS